jgi:hypothetical protein
VSDRLEQIFSHFAVLCCETIADCPVLSPTKSNADGPVSISKFLAGASAGERSLREPQRPFAGERRAVCGASMHHEADANEDEGRTKHNSAARARGEARDVRRFAAVSISGSFSRGAALASRARQSRGTELRGFAQQSVCWSDCLRSENRRASDRTEPRTAKPFCALRTGPIGAAAEIEIEIHFGLTAPPGEWGGPGGRSQSRGGQRHGRLGLGHGTQPGD